MNTREAQQTPSQIRCAGRTYEVNTDGYCPRLDAWIAYLPDGRLVTIPA